MFTPQVFIAKLTDMISIYPPESIVSVMVIRSL